MSVSALIDTRILTGRSLRHILRSPDTIITTAITPIAMMLLFVFVFGGAITTGSSQSYINYMLPGILIITIASGVAYTSYRLFLDMSEGMMLRLRSLPISRSSMLWGHVLTSLVANIISLLLVIGVAFLVGFRTQASPLDWLVVAALLLLTTLTLTWVAVIAGLSAQTVDGASAFSYPLILLPFVSSAFVPTDSMPSAVAWFAEHQPVTAIVNALRSLLSQGTVDSSIWLAVIWLLSLLAAAWGISLILFKRKTQR
ncbi:ABC transporter permease [Glutamicibacter sp. NPDC087344]|uniref:ABC transporter permease n=1 Tax=Glutamicibacter sp. NPDC087344 TaxID=3363994 RepID=UPI003820A43B